MNTKTPNNIAQFIEKINKVTGILSHYHRSAKAMSIMLLYNAICTFVRSIVSQNTVMTTFSWLKFKYMTIIKFGAGCNTMWT